MEHRGIGWVGYLEVAHGCSTWFITADAGVLVARHSHSRQLVGSLLSSHVVVVSALLRLAC